MPRRTIGSQEQIRLEPPEPTLTKADVAILLRLANPRYEVAALRIDLVQLTSAKSPGVRKQLNKFKKQARASIMEQFADDLDFMGMVKKSKGECP